MKLPTIFMNNNEDYITIPAIRKFAEGIPELKLGSIAEKQSLLEQIQQYANNSDINKERVLNWLDDVCREGTQAIQLTYARASEKIALAVKDIEKANIFIKKFINENTSPHICQNKYDKNFKLIDAFFENSKLGYRCVFFLCKKLTIYDKKQKHKKDIYYPVIAEYYIDNSWLLIKAKSKSNMYIYMEGSFNPDTAESTTSEKQMAEAKNLIKPFLELEENPEYAEETLKNKLFELLKQYTNTPIAIKNVLTEQENYIDDISKHISSLCNINGVSKDVKDDIRNTIEKYLSINWKDKNIFTKDREAYPVKLNATDDEASKVEQVAGFFQPLQTKAVFFDNKKMLYKNEKCDNISLKWKRLNNKYFSENFFVSISVERKGMCILKFRDYVIREDIENVLSKIIGV